MSEQCVFCKRMYDVDELTPYRIFDFKWRDPIFICKKCMDPLIAISQMD